MAQKASDKRIKYQLLRNPTDAEIPNYAREAYKFALLDRRQMSVVRCTLECLNKNGKKAWLTDAMVIHSQLIGDWDYNTLEPYLQKLEVLLLYIAHKNDLNPQKFIHPDEVPRDDIAKAPLI